MSQELFIGFSIRIKDNDQLNLPIINWRNWGAGDENCLIKEYIKPYCYIPKNPSTSACLINCINHCI